MNGSGASGIELKRDKLPNHVAIIMDGNGRWAKLRKKPRVFGHRNGMDSVRRVVRAADGLGIKVLSLYAFSEENWARPDAEINFIMRLLDTYLLKEREELNAKNIQIHIIGRRDRLPAKTQKIIDETEEMMRNNSGMVVNVAISYGGRSEIVEACRTLAWKVHDGEIAPSDIDRDLFAASLDTFDLPDPDLLIRTSGEQRLSNFMLWQMAYTEFYFSPVYWPDFGEKDFQTALYEFQRRQRRYGRVEPKVEPPIPIDARAASRRDSSC